MKATAHSSSSTCAFSWCKNGRQMTERCVELQSRISHRTHVSQELLPPADLNWKQIKERARGEDKRGWGFGVKISRRLQPADALHTTHESTRSSARHFDVNPHLRSQIHQIRETHTRTFIFCSNLFKYNYFLNQIEGNWNCEVWAGDYIRTFAYSSFKKYTLQMLQSECQCNKIRKQVSILVKKFAWSVSRFCRGVFSD